MQVFVQMSGVPGAGKTTIARAVARHIGAVVVDHEVTKTALLDADVPVAVAGYASYMVLDAVARHVLQQGFSVVFDSPCFYTPAARARSKASPGNGHAVPLYRVPKSTTWTSWTGDYARVSARAASWRACVSRPAKDRAKS